MSEAIATIKKWIAQANKKGLWEHQRWFALALECFELDRDIPQRTVNDCIDWIKNECKPSDDKDLILFALADRVQYCLPDPDISVDSQTELDIY